MFFPPFYSTIFSVASCAQFTAFMDLEDVRVSGVICRPDVQRRNEECLLHGSHFTSKQNNPFGEYSSHTGSKRMNTIVELYPLLLCRNWGLMLTDLCPRYQKPGFFCGIF